MHPLTLPSYEHRIRETDGEKRIFDPVRRKFVALTPEEWVRQNFLRFLEKDKGYPLSLMAVEMGFRLHKLQKRGDIVAHDGSGSPLLIVECKAPQVKVDQSTFDQIARYNMVLQVPWLVVTNGIHHYCCYIDRNKETYHFVQNIPAYNEASGENPYLDT